MHAVETAKSQQQSICLHSPGGASSSHYQVLWENSKIEKILSSFLYVLAFTNDVHEQVEG